MANDDILNATIDFTGVELWDPTKGPLNDPDPGAYKAKTTGPAVIHTKDTGKQSIKVTADLGAAGETDLYLGLDFSKPGNARKLATALQSCGVDYAKVKASGKKFTVKDVLAWFGGKGGKGADCYVLVKAVEGTDDRGRKKLNDKDFATKDQFEAYSAAMKSAPSNGAASGASAALPATSPAGDVDAIFQQ